MPRSRGAVSGLLLVVLGALGCVDTVRRSPFRLRLHARPGLDMDRGPGMARGATGSGHRGGWPAADLYRKPRQRDGRRLARGRSAGAWFVIGGQVAPLLGIGSRRRSDGRHRPQAGRARGCLLLRPGRADRFPGRRRVARLAVRAGARRRAFGRSTHAPAEPVPWRAAYMSGLEEPAAEVSIGRAHQAAATPEPTARRRRTGRGGWSVGHRTAVAHPE